MVTIVVRADRSRQTASQCLIYSVTGIASPDLPQRPGRFFSPGLRTSLAKQENRAQRRPWHCSGPLCGFAIGRLRLADRIEAKMGAARVSGNGDQYYHHRHLQDVGR